MKWASSLSLLATLLCVLLSDSANAKDQQHHRLIKRQIYFDDLDSYQPRDTATANTGHLPIAPHYPADSYNPSPHRPPGPSYEQETYKAPAPAYNPAPASYKPPAPYKPPVQVYKPTPAPYSPPAPAYKPTPAPYKPPAPAYKPTPAPYKPPVSAYKPTPAPYKPTPAPYKPAPAPYKPAPAPAPYKPAPAPYKPPSHKPKPMHHKPSSYEPEHKPYKPKNTIPGVAGKDYPIYNKVPYTKFSCSDVPYRPGMYANPEAGCQVYHVCDDDRHGPQGASFLCTNGTLFNQETFNCDWWYNVDCDKATSLYSLNTDPDHNPYYQKPYDGPLHIPKHIHPDAYKTPETSYKDPKPVHHAYRPKPSYHRPARPSYKPEPSYKPAPSYKPQPSYKPEPSYKPAPSYKPEPSYKPQPSYKPEPSYKPTPSYKPEPSYKPAPRPTYHAPAPKPKPTYHAPPKPAPKPTYHAPPKRPTYHSPAPKPSYHSPSPQPSYHKPAPVYESPEHSYEPRPWKAPAYKAPSTYHNKRETEQQIGFASAGDEATDFAWGDKL